MFKKLSKKKGFTLMEMMIVVAIIAILIAIIVPTFKGALDRAKAATDEANLRAYYAEVVAKKLLGEGDLPTAGTVNKITVDGVEYKLYGTATIEKSGTDSIKITYSGPGNTSATIPGGGNTSSGGNAGAGSNTTGG